MSKSIKDKKWYKKFLHAYDVSIHDNHYQRYREFDEYVQTYTMTHRCKKWCKKWIFLRDIVVGLTEDVPDDLFERLMLKYSNWVNLEIMRENSKLSRELISNTIDEKLPKTKYIVFESLSEIDEATKEHGTSVIGSHGLKYQITGARRNSDGIPCIILDASIYIPYETMLNEYVFESDKKPVGKEVPY